MRRAGLLSVLILASLLSSGCFGGIASDWAYKMVGLRAAQADYDGSGINIAIIDTGINIGHPSLDHLKDKIKWKDAVNDRPEPYDDVGHGTHVAGIVVGQGASFGGKVQGYNLKGGAPEASLIIAKVISEDETGSTADVVEGINFAIENKADVICMSLGRYPLLNLPTGGDLENRINVAINQGILVVASAGNYREGQERPDDVAVPARFEDVVAVGAVDSNGKVADFSVRGSESANQGFGPLGGVGGRPDPHKKPEVVAPGVGIRSAWTEDKFAVADGTSQAAPFVCSAFALLLQKCTTLRGTNTSQTVQRVKEALKETVEPVRGQRVPHDSAAGYGLLKADRLLEKFGASC